MFELIKGKVVINDIEISVSDSLTIVLKKTLGMSKTIRNINNYQHLFINDVFIYGKKSHVRFIFYPDGKMESISFSFSQECADSNVEPLLLFLKKHNIFLMKNTKGFYEKNFTWGALGVFNDPHYLGQFSIVLRCK